MQGEELLRIEIIKTRDPRTGEILELVRLQDFDELVNRYMDVKKQVFVLGSCLVDLFRTEDKQEYCPCSVCQTIRNDFKEAQEVLRELEGGER